MQTLRLKIRYNVLDTLSDVLTTGANVLVNGNRVS